MADDPKSKPPVRRRQRPPGKPKTRRPPNWRQKTRDYYATNPFGSDSGLCRALGVAPGGAVWRRWLEEDEQRNDPEGLRALREEARQHVVTPVDRAMLAEAMGGDVPAANLVYKRARVFDEQEQARAAAGAPSFNLNITLPNADTSTLIRDLRGEIERGGGSGPGVKHDDRPLLPGSSFLSMPSDDEIAREPVTIDAHPHTPESDGDEPRSPDPATGAKSFTPQESSRG